jgi:predicted MFS family arabinose efflux permease
LSASLILVAELNNIEEEIIVNSIMGLAAGFVYPASVKTLISQLKGKSRERALTIYTISGPLSVFLSGIIIPSISIHLGWKFSYYFSSIICLLLALSFIKMEKSTSLRNNSSIRIIREKSVFLISIGGFVFFLWYWSMALFLYRFLIDRGLTPTDAGIIYSLTAVAGIFSVIFSNAILKFIRPKRVLLMSSTCSASLITAFSLTSNYLILIPVSLSLGFFRFLMVPSTMIILSRKESNSMGTATGMTNLFWQLSGLACGFLFPSLSYLVGYDRIWLFLGFLSLPSVFLYYFID